MALINCPNCGKKVSEKAKTCPGCGNVFVEEKLTQNNLVICKECGTEILQELDVCPNCGWPVEKTDEAVDSSLQKVEIASVNMQTVTRSIKKYVIIAVVALAVIAIGIICGVLIKNNHDKEVAAKQSADYSEDLKSAVEFMMMGASSAEDAGNLIKSVWYNTIYEISDLDTDMYTKSDGWNYNDDFNDSLLALFTDSSFEDKIDSIKNNQQTVSIFMKALQNPPAEYLEAYSAVKELYDAYLELTGLAINPTGNLQTFSNNFNDADSETLKCYKAMNIYISD